VVRTQGISTQLPSATVPLSPIFYVALRRGRNGRQFQQAVEENEGGATAIMAPEPLASSRFGLENVVPTQERDIRSFGLAIFQAIVLRRYIHLMKFC
jgi:hypothetical protein